MTRKLLAILLALGMALAIPCQAASLSGYWKGPVKGTFDGIPYNSEAKIALAEDGSASFRWTLDSDTFFLGDYYVSGA